MSVQEATVVKKTLFTNFVCAGGLAMIALAAVFFGACGGDDDGDGGSDEVITDTAELEAREHELRDAVEATYKAIFSGDAAGAYSYTGPEFRELCPIEDFTALLAFAQIFFSGVEEEDIAIEVVDVRYEDGRAYVTTTGSINGEDLSGGTGETTDEGYWVYRGGWKLESDEDDFCDTELGDGDIDFDFDDDDVTPATGPGSSRAEAAPVGTSVDSGDWRITVLEVDGDASLEDINEFPETPTPGHRVVLARVRVEHAGEDTDDTIMVSEFDFKLTGSNNVIYDGFADDTSCGFIEGGIEGELFPGGTAEGYVCFQAPADETGLLLVAEPGFSFGGESRRFFELE